MKEILGLDKLRVILHVTAYCTHYRCYQTQVLLLAAPEQQRQETRLVERKVYSECQHSGKMMDCCLKYYLPCSKNGQVL